MNDHANKQDKGLGQRRGRGPGRPRGGGRVRGRGRGRGSLITPEALQADQALHEIQPVPGYQTIQPRPLHIRQRPASADWSPQPQHLHPAIPQSYDFALYNDQSQSGTTEPEVAMEGQRLGGEEEVRNWDRKYTSIANPLLASPSSSYVSPYAARNARRLSNASVTSQSSRPGTPATQSELEWSQKYTSPGRHRESITSSSPGRSKSPNRPSSTAEPNTFRRNSEDSSSRRGSQVSPGRTAEATASDQDPTTPRSKAVSKYSRRHQKRGPYNRENVVRRDSDGFISDGDSDYEEFNDQMAYLEKQAKALKNHDSDADLSHLGLEDLGVGGLLSGPRQGRQRIGRPPRSFGRGSHRGPRDAAPLTGELQMRVNNATELFLQEQYEEAKAVVFEILKINAETYQAWTLLAAIWDQWGEIELLNAWFNCAEYALEVGPDRQDYISHAQFAYAAAIRADTTSVEAHLGKARCYYEMDRMERALVEYKIALKLQPHQIPVLKLVAEACIDIDQVDTAIGYWKESIAHFRKSPQADVSFTWNDADVYFELLLYGKYYDQGIQELKSVSRWLRGREEETFWDDIVDNDCEWDASNSRRLGVDGFKPDKFPASSYELPLALRVKLGLYRLHLHSTEAMRHFNFLDPENKTGENRVRKTPRLCRNVADGLLELELYDTALKFYMPLKAFAEENTASLHIQIGKCFLGQNLVREGEASLMHAISLNDSDTDARALLAELYEERGDEELAFEIIRQVVDVTLKPKIRKKRKTYLRRTTALRPSVSASTRESPARVEGESSSFETNYLALETELEGMRSGDIQATEAWMAAAEEFTHVFRSVRKFYSWEKYLEFTGYTGEELKEAQTALPTGLSVMADRLSKSLHADLSKEVGSDTPVELTGNYRGIPFDICLDIFMEYAICLAKNGQKEESYDIVQAAKDARPFYESRDDRFLIHLCWCMCALISHDDQTLVNMARYFMKYHQFTTDSYRIFATLTRINNVPISWYNSGPTQKFILRHIKNMDYGLVDEETRKKNFADKAFYATDDDGNPILNADMDISLLMMYGYLLFMGNSYQYALNYFLRAHALDPENPMINLSIGIAYIHHSHKRLVDNRQHNILQGLTFIFRYYDSRSESEHVEERIESHYNVGRTYHMLGLSHLALPYYWKVLNESQGGVKEDLVIDTAYSMQTIYMMSGNPEMAQSITKEFLVV